MRGPSPQRAAIPTSDGRGSRQWARDEHAVGARIRGAVPGTAPPAPPSSTATTAATAGSTAPPEVSTAEVRAWARAQGIDVPDRGRLRPEVRQRYRDAHA